MMCGGFSESKPSDAQAQNLLNHHQAKINELLGLNLPHFTVVSYATQVVAGTNYCIKFKVNQDDYCAKIFVDLPCNGGQSELTSVTLCSNEANNCCA